MNLYFAPGKKDALISVKIYSEHLRACFGLATMVRSKGHHPPTHPLRGDSQWVYVH
jgi:hypothetical protein